MNKFEKEKLSAIRGSLIGGAIGDIKKALVYITA